jgi:hypothetical protein
MGVDYKQYTREQAEVIVDTVTFIVCAGAGLAVDGESIPYIAGWGEDGALPVMDRLGSARVRGGLNVVPVASARRRSSRSCFEVGYRSSARPTTRHNHALVAAAAIVVMALIESGVAHTLAIAGGWTVFIGVGILLARATARRQHHLS